MKKVLIYGTMAVVCVTGMFALTGCSNKEESVGGEKDKTGTTVVEESRPKEIVLSDASDKWPAGVYDYYGIPEYTSGTLVYAQPNSNLGEVYFNTTLDEFDAYIKDIEAKGFRYAETARIPNSSIVKGKIFDKETGKGYYIVVDFMEKSMPLGGENKTFNLQFMVQNDGYPEKNVPEDIVKDFGLTNEDILPKDKDVYVLKKEDYGTQTKISLDLGFDASVTDKEYEEYQNQLVDACAKISENGLLNEKGETVNADTLKKDLALSWQYTFGGKTYKIMFNSNHNIGDGLGFMIK